jgi:cytochrome c556
LEVNSLICSFEKFVYTAELEFLSTQENHMIRLTTPLILSAFIISSVAFAGPDPIESRQELMENTRDAAKIIGGMLKQKEPFDAAMAMEAFKVWQKTAAQAGALFPEGSGVGHDTEAKVTIWTDRAGFDEKLADFGSKVDAAIAANPDSLEALNAAAGPVFKACKACHEGYRVEKEE